MRIVDPRPHSRSALRAAGPPAWWLVPYSPHQARPSLATCQRACGP